jgi:hypothetical protein
LLSKEFLLKTIFIANHLHETTSAFGDKTRRMLKIIQRFSKHCNCHLQGFHVMDGRFWQPYIGHAVGEELEMIVLIGGAEDRAAIQ